MRRTNPTIRPSTLRLLIGSALAALLLAVLAPAAIGKGRPVEIKTLKPYGVNDTEAVLNSEVSPHGREIAIQFEWGKTKRYGHTTWYPEEIPYPYYQHQEAEEWIGGLKPNTVYHCRVIASFNGKKIFGNDVRFKTQRP
jgi:hypothetical protein